MKALLGLAATGVVAVVLYKVMILFLLPLVVIAIGVALLVFKVIFILFALMIAVWVFKKLTRRESVPA
jgi:hypothetical protein